MPDVKQGAPADPLRVVFTEQVLAILRARHHSTDQLQRRLEILDANGQKPGLFALRHRAIKAAWDTYLHAAFALGLTEGEHGEELLTRLRGHDDESFRSAMSECLAAWYLAGPLGLQVKPRPEGRPNHPLEFLIRHPDGDINVEVKAPYRPMHTEGAIWFDDSDMFVGSLREANKQFSHGVKNLLVVVPQMTVQITHDYRLPLEKAFIGETMISVPINPMTGGPVGPVTYPFEERGQLTRSGKLPPRFTRVGGVLYLGEMMSEDGRSLEHLALLVFNPNAVFGLPKDIWKDTRCFARQEGEWVWSDTGRRGL